MAQGVQATAEAGRGLSFREAVVARRDVVAVAGIVLLAGAFLVHQLMAWPPHEDETLALFVGRDSFAGVVEHVTRERGGAPLHFVLAWAVAHLGFGLGALRLVSAAFAVASLPLVATLGARLAGRRVGVVATALLAGSWLFLFHGVYGRMYSLFLFLSTACALAFLHALDRGGRKRWALWVAAALATVAAHPYGVLMLAGQGLYVVVARRDRLREAAAAGGAVVVLGIPFWITDLVLASRFDVSVGGGGAKLGGPLEVARYLWRSAGDASAGWLPVTLAAVALGSLGLAALRREARLVVVCMVVAPALAFWGARLGGAAAPESRHLVFVAPFFAVAVAAGLVRALRRAPALVPVAVAALLVAEVSWAWHRTPPLFEWEPDQRQEARADVETWLAETGRPDDVLFAYEPVYLGAWERNRALSRTVLPRADSVLALRVLERGRGPLGRAVFVLDASERNNVRPRLELEEPLPRQTTSFEAAVFGPFLVLRTREPVATPARYLDYAAKAMVAGRSLGIGDVDVNMRTVERAARALRGYGPSLRSRSSSSR